MEFRVSHKRGEPYMSEEWDKLWENLIGYLNHLNNKNLITGWLADIKSMGDKLRERVVYLEGLTDGDTKLLTAKLVEIQSLREENKLITNRIDNLQFCLDHCAETTKEQQQKLEAVRDYFEDHCIKCDAEDCFGCSFDHIKRRAGIPSKFAQKENNMQ